MPEVLSLAKAISRQSDATLSQDNPVSGTKYTVLDTVKNAKIYGISVVCTWTVQPDPIEIHITIDGLTVTHSQANPVSGTQYIPWEPPYGTLTGLFMAALSGVINQDKACSFLYEGKSIKVEAEVTGGTVSNLSARVKYGKW